MAADLVGVGCSYSAAMTGRYVPDLGRYSTAMLISILYAFACLLLDLAATRSRRDTHQLELLVLRHEVRVLRRQLKRVARRPGDRLLIAAWSRALPRSAWRLFPVRPETLMRWHRELVRREKEPNVDS